MLGIWPVIAGIAVFAFGTITWVANEKTATDQNHADLIAFETQILQTIADMKSNQLPRRVQVLEDQFAAAQSAAQATAQATQTAIAALQNSLQQSTNAQSSAMHDVTAQLGAQSNQIAAMSAEIQYYLPQLAPVHK
jgi:hypothetical protein